MSIIKPTGKFRGQEVIDAKRKHLEPIEIRRLFKILQEPLIEDNGKQFSFGPFWYGYFFIQYYFGCRVSEVALLLKEDVSLKTNEILVRRLKKKQFKKDDNGDKVRVSDGYEEFIYGLPPPVKKAAEAVLQEHKRLEIPLRNPWLFASKSTKPFGAGSDRMMLIRRAEVDGETYRAVSRDTADVKFREAATCARVPPRLRHSHTLRHTRATLLLAEGAPEEDVRFLLGHASISTTRRYLGIAKNLRLRMQTSAELGLGDFGLGSG